MYFRFFVNLSEEDYFKYNEFVMLRSHYGKKQIFQMRVMTALMAAILMLLFAFAWGFSISTLIGIIPMAIILVLFEIMTPNILVASLKMQLKSMKKSGKMAYTPNSTLEFYDDRLVEISDLTRMEQMYFGIEKVNVVAGETVYIHVNNVMAYILPISSFESTAQYENFMCFLKTKVKSVEIFNKK